MLIYLFADDYGQRGMTVEELGQANTRTERDSCHLVAAPGTTGGRERKWKVPLEDPSE